MRPAVRGGSIRSIPPDLARCGPGWTNSGAMRSRASRVLLAWQIGPDWKYHPDLVTEVEILFTPEGPDVTRVELEHRNLDRMGDAAADFRDRVGSPKGWPTKLDIFATVVNEIA